MSDPKPPTSSVPQRLDQLIQVTRPWVWVSLAAVGLVLLTAGLWAVLGNVSDTIEAQGILIRKGGVKALKSGQKGVVNKLLVVSGEKMQRGRPVAEIVDDQGKVHTVACPVEDGLVLRRMARESEVIEADGVVLYYERRDEPMRVLLYPSTSSGYRAEPDMPVHVTPSNVKQVERGYLIGKVLSAGKYPVTEADLNARLQNEALVRQLQASGPSLQILVELEPDKNTESGVRWSSPMGRDVPLYSGTPCQARIIVREEPPINLLVPGLLPPSRRPER